MTIAHMGLVAAKGKYFYKETVESAGTGKAIEIPVGGMGFLYYELIGDGTIEYTGAFAEDVEADTATWYTVTGGADINPAVGYVRHTNVTGTTVFIVRAQ